MPSESRWRSYRDVDATGDAVLLGGQLDDVASIPFVAAEKQRSLELLGLPIGGSALDVGCGNGRELERLAEIVGPRGRVVGLDPSTVLIEQAGDRGLDGAGPIELVVGDARSLPFADAEFHGTRADRTLQHLARPEVGLAEMVRVTRARGRVVATESRWGLVAPSLDRVVTDRVLAVVATGRERQKWVGYRLSAMFAVAGLTDVHDSEHDYAVSEPEDLFRFTHLDGSLEAAVLSGAVTSEQATGWRDRLWDLVSRGDAFAVAIILHVTGTKPGEAVDQAGRMPGEGSRELGS